MKKEYVFVLGFFLVLSSIISVSGFTHDDEEVFVEIDGFNITLRQAL